MTSNYRKEFKDFPEADMPAIPAGFEDVSWHNDAMPSFYNASLRLVIWVNYLDPELREYPEIERFSLHATDENGCPADEDDVLLVTDDWNAILHKIADIESELNRQGSSVPFAVTHLDRAMALLENAVGLLGGEPCDANDDSAAWFAKAEAFIKEVRGSGDRAMLECAEERAEQEGTDPIDERNADQDAADMAVMP